MKHTKITQPPPQIKDKELNIKLLHNQLEQKLEKLRKLQQQYTEQFECVELQQKYQINKKIIQSKQREKNLLSTSVKEKEMQLTDQRKEEINQSKQTFSQLPVPSIQLTKCVTKIATFEKTNAQSKYFDLQNQPEHVSEENPLTGRLPDGFLRKVIDESSVFKTLNQITYPNKQQTVIDMSNQFPNPIPIRIPSVSVEEASKQLREKQLQEQKEREMKQQKQQ